jgi:itaconyl-CoA hydratase
VNTQPLVPNAAYFEDFEIGDRYRHSRGKTVTEFEVVILCNLVMNTAQAHFNEHSMIGRDFGGQRVNFGGITTALVIGLATQDTAEQALAELGLDGIRLRRPVVLGDTLYALTEVLAKGDADRGDAGVVTFRHFGVNQRDEVVFEGTRTVLVKRRAHWAT